MVAHSVCFSIFGFVQRCIAEDCSNFGCSHEVTIIINLGQSLLLVMNNFLLGRIKASKAGKLALHSNYTRSSFCGDWIVFAYVCEAARPLSF